MIQIKVDSFAVDDLYKYCMKSPAEVPAVMARLLREWTKQTARKWADNPYLIPKMPELPESRMTTVGVNSDIAKAFKKTLRLLNMKVRTDTNKIQEEDLASILLVAYIKTYKVKEKGSWYRSKKWGSPG